MVALSSLSNNLNQTLASGERVLSLLEEKPMVEEIPVDVKDDSVNISENLLGGKSDIFSGAETKKCYICL